MNVQLFRKFVVGVSGVPQRQALCVPSAQLQQRAPELVPLFLRQKFLFGGLLLGYCGHPPIGPGIPLLYMFSSQVVDRQIPRNAIEQNPVGDYLILGSPHLLHSKKCLLRNLRRIVRIAYDASRIATNAAIIAMKHRLKVSVIQRLDQTPVWILHEIETIQQA